MKIYYLSIIISWFLNHCHQGLGLSCNCLGAKDVYVPLITHCWFRLPFVLWLGDKLISCVSFSRNMEGGHSGRSSFLLHIPCSWLGKCDATENSYLSVFSKVMRSNQGKRGDRHPALAEKNLLQKGFYSCSWDNIGNTVWLQLFLELFSFFHSILILGIIS